MWRGAIASSVVVALAGAGCSAVLDRGTTQCKVDSDCDKFEGEGVPVCQEGLCVKSELGPPGCVRGAPTTQADYLNACSTSRCEPFDNCDRLGLCAPGQALPDPTPPANPSIPPIVNAVIPPTQRCTDGAPGLGDTPNMIYLYGAADFGPLLQASQPSLSALPTAYRAVFQASSSCAGVNAVFGADPAVRTIHNPDNPATGGWAFYYDAQGQQVNCLLDDDGDTVDVGVSDLYAETCGVNTDPAATGVAINQYLGPVVPFVLSVRATSPEQAISAEAAHMVFGLRGEPAVGSGLKNASPWTDPNAYFIRNASAGSTILTSLLIDVPRTGFWGIDRLSTENLRDSLLASTAIDSSIGILAIDFNDKNRGDLKALYLQAKGQRCGYLPDASATTFDKVNVRDGHYPLWGYVHLFAQAQIGGAPNPAAEALVLLFSDKLDQRLLDEVIGASFIPQCAMKVARTSEIGDFAERRGLACGCYFDFKTTGKSSCQQCESAEDCPGKHPCNYGFCEVTEND
jgi:hypothetical protein